MPSKRNSMADKKKIRQEQHIVIPLRRSRRLQSKSHSATINPKFTKSPNSLSSTPQSTTLANKTHPNFNKSTPHFTESTTLSNNLYASSHLRRSPRFSHEEKFLLEEVNDELGQKVTKKIELKIGFDRVESDVGRSRGVLNTKICPEEEKSKCGQKIVKKNELKNVVDEVSGVRRSPRFSCQEHPKSFVAKAKKNGSELKRGNMESASVEVKVVKKEIGIKKKREVKNRVSNTNGWTKEEEVALQRAYFSVKPTTHFWNKVAKLVPGKSANDCFNKIHSDQSTPRQTQPRCRANKLNSSPLSKLSLSASKLLKPIGRNTRNPGYTKKKSHVARKSVRHLLRSHYNVDQDHEVDLFSVLEPTIQESTQKLTHSLLFSTPRNAMGKSRSLQKSGERSYSSNRNPLSRFSNVRPIPLASPPVLKQVKNKAVHEKYIDLLHTREAKRKAASTRKLKSNPRMASIPDNYKKMDKLKANLVSNAKNAINQLTELRANVSEKSPELDEDGFCTTDTDDEL